MKYGMDEYEKAIVPVKESLFKKHVGGDVLELGIGTGPNLQYYKRFSTKAIRYGTMHFETHGRSPLVAMPPTPTPRGRYAARVTGLDPNAEMLEYARKEAARWRVPRILGGPPTS